MKLKRASIILVMLSALITLSAVQSHAFLYAGKRKKINCGVVWLREPSPNPTTGENPFIGNQPTLAGLNADGIPTGDGVGDLFYLLELYTDMKPAGWTFDNPYAPADANRDRRDRLYWQVDLRAAADLSKMHVLYLPASGEVKLNIQDRDKLRQFVDCGGVLWIDNSGVGGQALNFGSTGVGMGGKGTFFITDFFFKDSGGAGVDVAANRHHPVLSLPYWLTDQEIATLGANWNQCVCHAGYDVGGSGGWGSVNSEPVNFDVLYPIVRNNGDMDGRPSIAANAYGSGRIVATSNFVGRGCYLNYPYSVPSLKFAYNVVTWASSWTHLRKDPRHAGASIDTVGGTRLLKFWSMLRNSGGGEKAPVIYKNVAFYSCGSTLYALDIMPQEDLDNDGNPDDGAQGLPSDMDNHGQDIIWLYTAQGTLSAPSVVTAQNPFSPTESVEAVLVQSSGGKVMMLEAFPSDGYRLMPEAREIPIEFPDVPANSNPTPPLYVNGWIYAVGGDGRLYAVNPSLENYRSAHSGVTLTIEPRWKSDPTVSNNWTPRSGPSFGYIKNETSGATVGVVYWFGEDFNLASGSGTVSHNGNDHVYSIPVMVCSDRLQLTADSGTMTYEARVTYNKGYIAKVPEVKIDIPNYPSLTPTVTVNAGIGATTEGSKSGYLLLTKVTIPSDALVYATYALQYDDSLHPANSQKAGLEPSSMTGMSGMSGPGVPVTTIEGTPAMGSDAMIYLSGHRKDLGVGSSVYGLKNDSNSQSTRWNYLLHDGVPANILAGAALPGGLTTLPGAICDSTGRVMSNPQIFSSPAYAGDKVFVTVTSDASGTMGVSGGPTAALVCFKANSDFVIRVTESGGFDQNGSPIRKAKKLINEATGREMQVKVWQPNLFGAGTTLYVPPTMAAQGLRRDMIDYNRGTITFNNFDQLKLRGGPGNVVATNTFSPSLPVWVFVDNVEVPVDFTTWAPAKRVVPNMPAPSGDAVDLSGWNNMLWFYPVPSHSGRACEGIHSSPVVIGNTVYFVCDDGYLYALPTETGESAGGEIDKKLLIWEGKVEPQSYSYSRGGERQGGGGPPNLSIASSNGVLLVPTPSGLYAYTNSTTLIADGSRVIEVDGAGEVRWGIDSLSWPVAPPATRQSAPPVTTGPINKPARAKYLASGDILIVNSGANQICRVDRTGTVSLGGIEPNYIRWVYDRFTDPKNLLPPGQPRSISSPTDALYWQEYEKQPGGDTYLRIDHCLIADSGNHRIVDLVYRYDVDNKGNPTGLHFANLPGEQPDPTTGFYLPELNWVTVTSSTNEKFNFNSLQLVTNTDGVNQDIYAAVSNHRGNFSGTSVQSEGLGGAIFAIRYRARSAVADPWNYADPVSGQIIAACDRFQDTNGVQPLACPRYVQVVDHDNVRYLLICDNYGVYQLKLEGSGPPTVFRRLTTAKYNAIERELIDNASGNLTKLVALPYPLLASSVQELPNENWLITNSYSGTDTTATRSFTGEVFEVSGWDKDTGIPNSISWCSPPLYCDVDTAERPIEDTIKQKLENGYVLQQPRSAIRQQ